MLTLRLVRARLLFLSTLRPFICRHQAIVEAFLAADLDWCDPHALLESLAGAMEMDAGS
jgi:hypothetical protein